MDLTVKCKSSPAMNPTQNSRIVPAEITVVSLTPEQVGKVKRELTQYVVDHFDDVQCSSMGNAAVVLLYDLAEIDATKRRNAFLELQYRVYDFLATLGKVEMRTVVDSRKRIERSPRGPRTSRRR